MLLWPVRSSLDKLISIRLIRFAGRTVQSANNLKTAGLAGPLHTCVDNYHLELKSRKPDHSLLPEVD